MTAEWQGPTIGAAIAVVGIGINNAFLFRLEAKRWASKRTDVLDAHRLALFREHMRLMHRLPFEMSDAIAKKDFAAPNRLGSLIADTQGDWELFGSERVRSANNEARTEIQRWIRESTEAAAQNEKLSKTERRSTMEILRETFDESVQPKLKRLADEMNLDLMK